MFGHMNDINQMYDKLPNKLAHFKLEILLDALRKAMIIPAIIDPTSVYDS